MKALRLALYLVVGLLLGAASVLSYAGTFSSYQGSAFRNINGTSYWKGDKGTLAQSQATVLESVQIGGTYMTIPTMGQITGAAMTAAMAGVRASPVIASASTLAWLAQQGLQYMDGEFKKPVTPTGYDALLGLWTGTYVPGSVSGSLNDLLVIATNEIARQNGVNNCPNGAEGSGWCPSPATLSCTGGPVTYNCSGYLGGILSYTRSNPTTAPTTYQPAGQSDWDRVNGVTPPDDVMKDLCQSLAKYNTSTPGCAVFNARTTGVTQPLSDWSPVPGGNTSTRQVATWKPSPTPDDPFRGELSINEETKTTTSTTDPVTGETTTSETTTSKDKTDTSPLCQLYPDILACAKFGEAEAPASIDKEKQVSINPDSGFGASDGQCPADLTYTVRTGHTLRLSYQPVCTGLRTFRPVIIGMAWISAVLIFLGIARKAQG